VEVQGFGDTHLLAREGALHGQERGDGRGLARALLIASEELRGQPRAVERVGLTQPPSQVRREAIRQAISHLLRVADDAPKSPTLVILDELHVVGDADDDVLDEDGGLS